MVKDNPYIDTNNTRTFSKDVDAMSLIWHTDQEDRTVTVLEGKGWQFQRDNELPLALTEGDNIFIPCLLYTSPSPRDRTRSRMPSSA